MASAPVDPRFDGITRSLCEASVAVRLEDVPDHTVLRAKLLTLDGIACGFVGSRLPWAKLGVQVYRELEGSGPCQVWGWGDLRLPLGAAALLNGTFIQGYELDDYHEVGPLHSEAVVLPAVFNTAETLGSTDGARALLAVIVGFEVGPRLGIAFDGHQMLVEGWHCGAIYGTPTAAVAAGVMRGLDARQMEDAFSMGATQASGLMSAQFEAMVKRMHHGFAARGGVEAAALAAADFTGIKGVLERPYGGMFATFAPDRMERLLDLMKDWGEDWELERINAKPYAAQGGMHSTIDAARQFRDLDGVRAEDVKEFRIHCGSSLYNHAGWQLQRPAEVIGAQMNIAYGAAVGLIDGDALIDQFKPDRVNRDDIWDFLPKVSVHHRESMDRGGKMGVSVDVELVDGRTLSRDVPFPSGSGKNLLTTDEIMRKYRSLMHSVSDDQLAEDIADAVMQIEEDGQFARLLGMLHAPARAPF